MWNILLTVTAMFLHCCTFDWMVSECVMLVMKLTYLCIIYVFWYVIKDIPHKHYACSVVLKNVVTKQLIFDDWLLNT